MKAREKEKLETIKDENEDEEEEIIDTKVRRKAKKKVKVDDLQLVKNLVDFSAKSKEDQLQRDRKKWVYTILAQKQKEEVFELKLDEIWNIIKSNQNYIDLIGSKENMIHIINLLEIKKYLINIFDWYKLQVENCYDYKWSFIA